LKHLTRIVLATALSAAAFPIANAQSPQPQPQSVTTPCPVPKKHGWLNRFLAKEKAQAQQIVQAQENKAAAKISRKTGGTVDASTLPTVPAIPSLPSTPCTPVSKTTKH
jgi:hypothetical protein